jgi:hypothetical protein
MFGSYFFQECSDLDHSNQDRSNEQDVSRDRALKVARLEESSTGDLEESAIRAAEILQKEPFPLTKDLCVGSARPGITSQGDVALPPDHRPLELGQREPDRSALIRTDEVEVCQWFESPPAEDLSVSLDRGRIDIRVPGKLELDRVLTDLETRPGPKLDWPGSGQLEVDAVERVAFLDEEPVPFRDEPEMLLGQELGGRRPSTERRPTKRVKLRPKWLQLSPVAGSVIVLNHQQSVGGGESEARSDPLRPQVVPWRRLGTSRPGEFRRFHRS